MPQSTAGTVTTDTIEQVGHAVREVYGADDLNGLCRKVNEDIVEQLIDRGLPYRGDSTPSVEHVRIGPHGEQKHFVAEIPATSISDVPHETGVVIVDAALDQFTTAECRQGRVDVAVGIGCCLPDVLIAPPSDPRRKVYSDPGDAMNTTRWHFFTEHQGERVVTAFENATDGPLTSEYTFDTSARTGIAIGPTDLFGRDVPDCAGCLVIKASHSVLDYEDGPSPPWSPRQAVGLLKTIDRDLRRATPSGITTEWIGMSLQGEPLIYRGAIRRKPSVCGTIEQASLSDF